VGNRRNCSSRMQGAADHEKTGRGNIETTISGEDCLLRILKQGEGAGGCQGRLKNVVSLAYGISKLGS